MAPQWTQAQAVTQYGWLAFAFAVGGIVLYFAGLMCTHLAAFRTAENIRKQGVEMCIRDRLPAADARENTPGDALFRPAHAAASPGDGCTACGGNRQREKTSEEGELLI